MTEPDPNPYESPQTVTTEPRTSQITPSLRILLRFALLTFAGFASFFTIGLLFVFAAETFELDIFPSFNWAIKIGVVGAALFFSSELFNSGRGRQAGFIARFVACIAIFLLSGIIAAFIGPPQPRRYEETDPYWLHRLLIFTAILIPALAIARLLWLGNHSSSNSETPSS